MLNFREDMIKLSQKYPFIESVVITPSAWSAMCNSFDKTLDREEGTTEGHIEEKNGSMKFETLFVEKKI